MFTDCDALEIEELQHQVTQLMTEGLMLIEKELCSMRGVVGQRSKRILDEYRNRLVCGGSNTALIDATRNFLRYANTQLTKIEETCLGCRVNGNLELANEIKQRLEPPSYTRPTINLKLCGYLQQSDSDGPRTYKPCPCNWRNIPEEEIEPTQDIILKGKRLPRSDFDLSDLKFKQELANLRTKTFVMPKKPVKSRRVSGFHKFAPENKNFIEDTKDTDSFTLPEIADDMQKIGILKFVDGVFKISELWKKLLDAQGQQLRSKWLLVVCPQIEAVLKRFRVPVAHFFVNKIYWFIDNIPQNGINFVLVKEDLLPLLENRDEVSSWFEGWRLQFKTIEGKDFAAAAIQRLWRGYWVRKNIYESECKYIAASIIWSAWMMLKKKRDMHQRYLDKMLTMLSVTKELVRKLSDDYQQVINKPHVVIHLPSLGYELDIRRTFPPQAFTVYQNALSLKLSFLQNPNADVVYILPVKPSSSLLRMYYDVIESVHPNEEVQKRMTFLELSQADTFSTCTFNVARTLYCSDATMDAIAVKVAGRPAYFLPWIVDECDVRIAGSFGIPLLGPNMELQLNLINKSYVAGVVDGLKLLQPAFETNVKDYTTLCSKLAELICLNTEVCLWLIKLNVGQDGNQTGIFLINHISVPFMPILRKEKEIIGDDWKTNPELRQDFLNSLLEHLPTVVSNVTRLSSSYRKWKDFYAHLVKYGCLLQAVPNEKISSLITTTLFIPGESTGQKPEWTGTTEQIHLDSRFTCFGYMMPQTSIDNQKLHSTVNVLAETLQKLGYFGHVSFDLYCYTRKKDDQTVVLIIDVDPYYGHAQHFVDWFSFAINGKYNPAKNTFESDVILAPVNTMKRMKEPGLISTTKIPMWYETIDRYGVATGRLYHSNLAGYRWGRLKTLAEECGIIYDAQAKQGSHIVLYDDEQRERALMSVFNVSMKNALELMGTSLKNLNKTISVKSKAKTRTNLGAAAMVFANLALNYQAIDSDKCIIPIKLK